MLLVKLKKYHSSQQTDDFYCLFWYTELFVIAWLTWRDVYT